MEGTLAFSLLIFILKLNVFEFGVDCRLHLVQNGRPIPVLIKVANRRKYLIKCCGHEQCHAGTKRLPDVMRTTLTQEADDTKNDEANLDGYSVTSSANQEITGTSDPNSDMTDPNSGNLKQVGPEDLKLSGPNNQSQNGGQSSTGSQISSQAEELKTTPDIKPQTISINNPHTTLNPKTTIVNDLETTTKHTTVETTLKIDPQTTVISVALNNDPKTTYSNVVQSTEQSTLNNYSQTTLSQGSQSTLNSGPQTTVNNAPETTVNNAPQTTLNNAPQTTLNNAPLTTPLTTLNSNIDSTTSSTNPTTQLSESSSVSVEVTTLSNVDETSAETTLNNKVETTSETTSPTTIETIISSTASTTTVETTTSSTAGTTTIDTTTSSTTGTTTIETSSSTSPSTTLPTTTTVKTFIFSPCQGQCPAQCSCDSETDVLLDADGKFAAQAVTEKLHGKWQIKCGRLKDKINITRLNQNIAKEEFSKNNISDYICCYNCIKMTEDEIHEHECIVGMNMVRMNDTIKNDKINFDKGTRRGNCSMIKEGKYDVTVDNINTCRPELKLGNAGDGGPACPVLNTWKDCPMSLNVSGYSPDPDIDCSLVHADSVKSPTCTDKTEYVCDPLLADGVCKSNFPYDTNKVIAGQLTPLNGYGTWAPVVASCGLKFLLPNEPNLVSWVEGRRICRDLGMKMPGPSTAGLKTCLAQAAQSFNFPANKEVWVNTRAIIPDLTNWIWCATIKTFTPASPEWFTGNPDLTNLDKECAALNPSSQLVNVACTTPTRVICSIGAAELFGA